MANVYVMDHPLIHHKLLILPMEELQDLFQRRIKFSCH